MLKELKNKLFSAKETAPEEKSEVKAEKKVKEPKAPVAPKRDTVMDRVVADSKNPPVIGDLVEGAVINIEKSAVYIDLAPFGTGIIFGREFITARDIIKKINIGDTIAAKVVYKEIDGERVPETISYHLFPALLLNMIKLLKKEVDVLKESNLEKQILLNNQKVLVNNQQMLFNNQQSLLNSQQEQLLAQQNQLLAQQTKLEEQQEQLTTHHRTGCSRF
jgi:hypothetical protein